MTEILKAFTFLLGFQLLGTATVMGMSLPIPGPVAGLLFLIGWLGMNAPRPKLLKETAQGLIAHCLCSSFQLLWGLFNIWIGLLWRERSC